ncbi:Sterol uptake control protein-like protein [Emericellopsis cladophorae]|uniref:Sterol uptake control protein-like protein n=1 Tax=Emericellopsis cladophorae TaxID=2686198 RepID=A0A9P9XVU6_9HYPO|nr:Sterol uptake control protein-like protein [Emericellopsis cladophorae]KAI6778766.1 Sterol uptake control protein-like protein [Emericellopsis cladophorae]
MLTYPETEAFDYGAFLQQSPGADDANLHLASPVPPQPLATTPQLIHQTTAPNVGTGKNEFSDSSLGRTTPSSSGNRTGSTDATRKPAAETLSQRQRLERKGHTKSRRGCFNCKRRRIKCQETHPACGHCVKTGLKCEYPAAPQITHQDMRLFQHFLTHCYPHHPLKQESVWTHEVPCIAHNHEFLMHAILGLAASELTQTDSSFVAAAMSHRVKAIKSIKKRLADASKDTTSPEETNALLATCYALTFQSVSVDDGLVEYMTFIRGIVIVGMQMMFRKIQPIFSTLFEEAQDEILGPLMQGLPLIRKGWTDAAMEAISALRPLCVEPVEVEYQGKLLDIAQKLYTSSWTAYKAHSQQHAWWMMLPHNVFQELISPKNQVLLLLHTHWISLIEIMTPITQQEREVCERRPPENDQPIDLGFARWLKYINARVDYEHQMFNQWPMWIEAQLDKDITFFGKVR